MKRNLFEGAIFGLAVLLMATTLGAAGRKPNVILILADDLGYGDLGCYGQERFKTPNIDRLAREGMRFTQFYAGGSLGAPSRAALFTGKHTGHAHRGSGGVLLRRDEFTLSKMFRYAGYRVDGIGRWALGSAGTSGSPKVHGFNQWVGFLDDADAFNYFPTRVWRWDSVSQWNDYVANHNQKYVQDLFNHAAEQSVRINADYQFFLYLPFTIPHANPKLEEAGMQVPTDSPYSAEDWPQPEKNKAAMISRLDQSVGYLRGWLEQRHLDRDSIIILTSDNGPHGEGGVDPEFFRSAGPHRGIKGDLYEGGLRVPMIVCWPGRIKAGEVNDRVWAMWDLLPTLAEVSGYGEIQGKLDGISMLPTWLGQKQTNQHDVLYWERHDADGGLQQAVRTNDWKGVRLKQDESIELYQLNEDPGEGTNVAAQHPLLVTAIEQLMKREHQPSERSPAGSGKQGRDRDRPVGTGNRPAAPGDVPGALPDRP